MIKWTWALIVLSVISAGVVVVWSAASTGSSEQATAALQSYVRPSVVFPTPTPGCSQVEAPSSGTASWSTIFHNQFYDNPRFPWLSGPKAGAMSGAVRSALPASVKVGRANPMQSLIFQPIPITDTAKEVDGSTNANGTLIRDGRVGSLSVTVEQWNKTVPPCVAGSLDHRAVNADGVVVDTLDTWSETGGVRTTTLTARAYTSDTEIYAVVDNVDMDARAEQQNVTPTGSPPLTIDELTKIVTDPGLRISTPVPAGTLTPPSDCSTVETSQGPALDQAKVDSLNNALDGWSAQHPELPAFGEPAGSLQLANFTRGVACETIATADFGVKLTITISGGNQLPVVPDRYDPINPASFGSVTTLPDGSVVGTTYSFYGATASEQGSSTSVTLTRPTGTRIIATSDDRTSVGILTNELLNSLVNIPGLNVN